MSDKAEDTNVSKEENKYPLVWIRGFPLFEPLLIESTIKEVLDFKPCDSDVFIVTYPKCGTTWTQFLVWEIMHKGVPPPSPNQIMFRDCPFLEYAGLDAVENLNHPRVMKTHFPFHLQPYNPLAKYIYIVRDPWDCCVSFYHHIQMDSTLPKLSFDEYFNHFLSGEIGWGNYFDHVISWSEHRNDTNVLFMTYEGLKKDTRSWLLKIAKFLGDSYYEDLQNEEVVESCLRHSDFGYLKQMGMFFPKAEDFKMDVKAAKEAMKLLGEFERGKPSDVEFEEVPFFRKGVVGDWKNHFTPEHIKRFNAHMTQKLKNTNMEHFWSPLIGETAM